jgi:hypothetical protein
MKVMRGFGADIWIMEGKKGRFGADISPVKGKSIDLELIFGRAEKESGFGGDIWSREGKCRNWRRHLDRER